MLLLACGGKYGINLQFLVANLSVPMFSMNLAVLFYIINGLMPTSLAVMGELSGTSPLSQLSKNFGILSKRWLIHERGRC